jgi:phytoene synthase
VSSSAHPPRAEQSASDVIARHSRSFALAVRLLPEPARSDARVIYAWCRHADDAIDGSEGSDQRAALARLRAELGQAYDPAAPAGDGHLQSFREVVARCGIPLEYPAELLAGMEMDVLGRDYASVDELLVYCHRVASTVGLMMCHVLGAFAPEALRHAAHLGVAMQLTNICRDVAEDWQRGRCYLPLDVLDRHGARSVEAPAGGASERRVFPALLVEPCRGAVRELLAIADRYYASADLGLRYLPWRAALAVCVARRVYAAIGEEIARRGHDVTAGRAVVSPGRKAELVAGALAQTLASRGHRRSRPSAPLPTVQYGTDLALI